MMQKLVFKNTEHAEVNLDKPRITIGRDKSNDVVLAAEGISGFHAEIQLLDDQAHIIDLGSTNGTTVNGKKFTGKHVLKPQDVLAFDQVEAHIVDPSARQKTVIREAIKDDTTVVRKAVDSNATEFTTAVGSTQVVEAINPKLVAVSGEVSGQSFTVTKDIVTIGRNLDNDIVIADSTVSGRHARLLVVRGGRWKVEDFGSTNGIKLNNNKVAEGQLASGDVIHLGNVRLRFDDGQVPAEATRNVQGANKGSAQASVQAMGQQAAGQTKMPAWGYALIGFSVVAFGAVFYTYTTNKLEPQLSGENQPAVVAQQALAPKTESISPAREVVTAKVAEQPDTIAAAKEIIPQPASSEEFSQAGDKPVAPEQMLVAKLQLAKNWTYSLPTSSRINATPALADVNGDRFLDVIIADAKGFIAVLDGQKGKKMLDINVPGAVQASISTADLSGDGEDDFVIATETGEILAVNGEGKVLWKSPGDLNIESIINRPTLVDVTGDAVPDVIIPTSNKGLVGLDGSRGWKLWDTAEMTKGSIVGSPIAADINSDGVMDFVSVSSTGQILALSAKGKKVWQIWKQDTSAIGYASPMFLKSGKQGLVVIATQSQGIVALDANSGRFMWMANDKLQKETFASPIATDVNKDGVDDVITVTRDGSVFALNGRNGDELWSKVLGVGVEASPAFFDVNGDKVQDIIVLDSSGRLLVIDATHGRTLMSLDTELGGFFASPVLGDINNDGLVDIVVATTNGTVVAYGMNRTTRKGSKNWPIFLGNNTHTAD